MSVLAAAHVGAMAKGAPAGGGVLHHDTFTPAGSNTPIESVTPDIAGTGYSLHPDIDASSAILIRHASSAHPDGRVGASETEIDDFIGAYFTIADRADVVIEFEVAAWPANTGGRVMGVFAREQSSKAAYLLAVLTNGAAVIRRVTGFRAGSTNLGSTNVITNGAGDRFRFTVAGSSLKLDYKPAAGSWSEVISVTDTNITDAGKTGLYIGGYYSGTDDIRAEWLISEIKVSAP